MRFVDLLLTVPPLVTVLVAAAFLHTNTLSKTALLFALVLWMPVARVVRSASLVVRQQEYVDAARAMGASDLRIIRRHVLPNVIGAAAVAASVLAASVVILETTLSFLGLARIAFAGGRTDATFPSLGDVLAGAQNEGLFNWWGIVFPGLTVILIVAPIYFIGDGIRDALDPTERRYVSERELARRRRGPTRLTRMLRAIPRPEVHVRIRVPQPLLAVSDALARRRARRSRSRLSLLVELAVRLRPVGHGARGAGPHAGGERFGERAVGLTLVRGECRRHCSVASRRSGRLAANFANSSRSSFAMPVNSVRHLCASTPSCAAIWLAMRSG